MTQTNKLHSSGLLNIIPYQEHKVSNTGGWLYVAFCKKAAYGLEETIVT